MLHISSRATAYLLPVLLTLSHAHHHDTSLLERTGEAKFSMVNFAFLSLRKA